MTEKLAADSGAERAARETQEQAVSRIHREFSNGPGNSFKYVGAGGMWKLNAVLELMRLAYLEGAAAAPDEGGKR